LTVRTHASTQPSADEPGEFTFDGEPFRLMDAQRGIFKPPSCSPR